MVDDSAAALKILVVDDDLPTRRLLQEVFRSHGFGVVVASDGDVVLGLVKSQRPEVVVLDLMMPGVSGLEALHAMRTAGEDVPVVVLTGMLDEDCILDAFDAGADDYVTKPFQPRVLVARVRAVARRRHQNGAAVDGESLPGERVGDVTLDPRTHRALVRGRAVALSPTEYRLLRTLMRRAGRIFTSADLLARVWGPAYVGQDDIVRANIYRLRRKLEPAPDTPRYILGRRGVGYHFALP
jgi:DNA-binding response OmpR family regulator